MNNPTSNISDALCNLETVRTNIDDENMDYMLLTAESTIMELCDILHQLKNQAVFLESINDYCEKAAAENEKAASTIESTTDNNISETEKTIAVAYYKNQAHNFRHVIPEMISCIFEEQCKQRKETKKEGS